jgi:hypothetical protein
MREEEVPVASRERARSLMLGHFQCAMPSRGRSDTTAAHRMRIAHLLDEALRITSAYSFASDDSSGETFQLSDPLPRSKRHAKENQQ